MPVMRKNKYLRYLYLPVLFGTQRTKQILHVNPTEPAERVDAADTLITIYDYNAEMFEEKKCSDVSPCFKVKDTNQISWINIDGLRKADVEAICNYYEIHQLIMEDILSVGQRPKMDEIENVL